MPLISYPLILSSLIARHPEHLERPDHIETLKKPRKPRSYGWLASWLAGRPPPPGSRWLAPAGWQPLAGRRWLAWWLARWLPWFLCQEYLAKKTKNDFQDFAANLVNYKQN